MFIDTKAFILITAILVVALILIISIVRRVKRGYGTGTSSSSSLPENEQVYVGNLPYRASERDLRDYFSSYGKIVDLRIVKDRKSGRSKGYAFITFSSVREADKSLESHGKDMQGRSMVVRIAKPR